MERVMSVCYFCDESYEIGKLDGPHKCKSESKNGYSTGKWSDEDDFSPITPFLGKNR